MGTWSDMVPDNKWGKRENPIVLSHVPYMFMALYWVKLFSTHPCIDAACQDDPRLWQIPVPCGYVWFIRFVYVKIFIATLTFRD